MTESYMTIQSFAVEIQMSVDHLIEQFLKVGITKTKFDFVTQSEKEVLFKHMNCNKIAIFNKFALQRKTHQTLNISSTDGKNKKIQVEVRKKRVYMVKCPTIQESNEINAISILKNNEKDIDCGHNQLIEYNKSVVINDNDRKDCHIFKKHTLQREKKYLDNKTNIVNTNQLEIKDDCKINEKSIKAINLDQNKKLNVTENIYDYQYTELSLINIKKHNHYSSNKADNITTLKKNKSIDLTLENEKKYNNNRIRSRHRNLGRITKQKKYNDYYSYTNMMNELDGEEKSSVFNRINKNKRKQSILVQSFSKPINTTSRDIVIGETVSVIELSNKMSIKSSYMIKVMRKLGLIVTINQVLDQETAQLVIEEMGHHAILRRENELEEFIMNDGYHNNATIDTQSNIVYKKRAPIVTMVGHVDHGKTSLLDYIRSSKIVSSESGGITQSIGTYYINIRNSMITFLDTPGHEAFINMRARGIQVTDIAVLVVAVDDGVMPQTIESIRHIKDCNIPVVVAINKIDKSKVNIERIQHELNHYGLIPEKWGGDTQFINVSAISGAGINDLLDAILLQAEILDLKAVHYGRAKAVVIESSLDKGQGLVVTALVREGELKCGDIILCGSEYGRVRAMKNSFGCNITTAGPSIPIKLLGLSGSPVSGELIVVVQNEKKAKEVALYRKGKKRDIKLARKSVKLIAKNVFDNINNRPNISDLNLIIKSDTHGSSEAICDSLRKLSTDEIIIKVISASVGNITETDFTLALTSKAIILGFNVKPDFSTRHLIETHNLNVRYYSTIYNLIDSVKELIFNMRVPKYNYEVIGIAEVYNIFRSPIYGTIAGCMVTRGVIRLNKKIKLVRDDILIYEGELESLRHFKNDVHEVKKGIECGIKIRNYNDVYSGDIIEVLDVIKKNHI